MQDERDVIHVDTSRAAKPRSAAERRLDAMKENETGVYGPGWGGRVQIPSPEDMAAYLASAERGVRGTRLSAADQAEFARAATAWHDFDNACDR